MGIARFLIGIASVLFLGISVFGFMMSGLFESTTGMSGALLNVLPVVCIFTALLGFWSLAKKNISAQYAFAIILLLWWSVGTILGAIIIALLAMSNKDNKVNKEA